MPRAGERIGRFEVIREIGRGGMAVVYLARQTDLDRNVALKQLGAEWPRLLKESIPTTYATLGGFALSIAFGIPMALVIAYSRTVESYVYPLLVFSQSVPKIAIAPLFVVWFGFGIESKIVVAVTTAFFVVLVNTLAGIDAVHRNSVLLMRSLVASKRQIFFMLTLPSSLPYVFAGLKTAATLALIGALVGEFVTARQGLGRLLTQFSFALKQDLVFATVLMVGLLGVLMYGSVALLQRRLVWWKP